MIGAPIISTSSFLLISAFPLTVPSCPFSNLAWKESEKEGVARVVENMECVMWSSMDQSEHRTSERVIEETVIMNNSELEQCANCHKSRVWMSLFVDVEYRSYHLVSLRSLQDGELLLEGVSGEGLEDSQDVLRRFVEGLWCVESSDRIWSCREGERRRGEASEGGGEEDLHVSPTCA